MVDGVVELSNCACISINCSRRLLYVPVMLAAELALSADEAPLDAAAVVIVTVSRPGK